MNENTSKSEEAKVGLGNEVIGFISGRIYSLNQTC